MPIPQQDPSKTAHGITYSKIDVFGRTAAEVLCDLQPNHPWLGAHLDPDLRANNLPRLADWRPLFGQADKAQSHLATNQVGVGDLFLFFGWFRETQWDRRGRLTFRPGAPNIHLLFGWLEVGEVWDVGARPSGPWPAWARYHPHAHTHTHSRELWQSQHDLRCGSQFGRRLGMPVARWGFRALRPAAPTNGTWRPGARTVASARLVLSSHRSPTTDLPQGIMAVETRGPLRFSPQCRQRPRVRTRHQLLPSGTRLGTEYTHRSHSLIAVFGRPPARETGVSRNHVPKQSLGTRKRG